MKFMAAALTATVTLACTPHADGAALSASQASALEVAARAGADNQPESWPLSAPDFAVTFQAIVLHESSACKHLVSRNPHDKHSVGCGQIRLRTARALAGVKISTVMLTHDWELNLQLSARYLAYCFARTHTWERAVVCYNRGPGRARAMTPAAVATDPYLAFIRKSLRDVKKLDVSYD